MRIYTILYLSIFLVSCRQEKDFKFCSNDVKYRQGIRSLHSAGIKRTADSTFAFKMGKWEWLFPWSCNTSWELLCCYQPICYSPEPLSLQVIFPDSMGTMSMDSTMYRDTVFDYLVTDQHIWIVDNIQRTGGKFKWEHSVVNTGKLPITLTKIISRDTCVEVEFKKESLEPGDTMKINFSADCPRDPHTGLVFTLMYDRETDAQGNRSVVPGMETATYYFTAD